MNACYGGVNGDKYVITGMPRNDLLLSSDGKKNIIWNPKYRFSW